MQLVIEISDGLREPFGTEQKKFWVEVHLEYGDVRNYGCSSPPLGETLNDTDFSKAECIARYTALSRIIRKTVEDFYSNISPESFRIATISP